jgi:hypothetical protein
MSSDVTRFHVAGIGPSDVESDIRSLGEVVRKLADDFAVRNVDVQFHHWTGLAPGLGQPQQYIDKEIDWSQMDFVVGAMWQRYGSPLEDGHSGTEHEVNKVLDLFKAYKEPDLLFYFREDLSAQSASAGQRGCVLEFMNRLRQKALVDSYSGAADFATKVERALRRKIEDRILAQTKPIQKHGGALPSNRRITIELIMSSEIRDGQVTPVILLLKNPKGEEFFFDTRHHTAQDIADWIANSMGQPATPGLSINDVLIPMFFDNIRKNTGIIQLWIGNIIQTDCKHLKIGTVKIALAKTHKHDGKLGFDPKEMPQGIPYPRPKLQRENDGRSEITL